MEIWVELDQWYGLHNSKWMYKLDITSVSRGTAEF